MRPRHLDVRQWVGTSELLTTNPKTFEDEMKTNKQSGRKGGVAPSSKAKKQKTTKVKQVLSDDEFVGSLGDFFHGLSGVYLRRRFSRSRGDLRVTGTDTDVSLRSSDPRPARFNLSRPIHGCVFPR